MHYLQDQKQILLITGESHLPSIKLSFFDSVTYEEVFSTSVDKEVYTNAKVLQLSIPIVFGGKISEQLQTIAQMGRGKSVTTYESILGRFALILFSRDKADKVCRLIKFELNSTNV